MSTSASLSTSMWFLAPPSACTRLPLARAGLVDVPGDRRGADEADRGDVRVLEQAVDGDLVALHDVEAAGREPGLWRAVRRGTSDTDGSFSLGLSTNVLPQASALANIHIGTIAGKLNGVMPATTPSGWRIEYTSMPLAACSEYSPLISCGMPHANSMFSSPRATSPSASVSTLPCSAVSIDGDLLAVRVDQFAQPEHHLGALRQRRGPPRRERRLRGRDRGVDLVGRREIDRSRLLTGRRVVDDRRAAGRRLDDLAVDPVTDSFIGSPLVLRPVPFGSFWPRSPNEPITSDRWTGRA